MDPAGASVGGFLTSNDIFFQEKRSRRQDLLTHCKHLLLTKIAVYLFSILKTECIKGSGRLIVPEVWCIIISKWKSHFLQRFPAI